MAKKARPQPAAAVPKRRRFTDDFRREAVQMMLDGHSAPSVAQRLGITCTTLLYRWKQQQLRQGGPVATSLDDRVRELEAELLRIQRERDILPLNTSISFSHFSWDFFSRVISCRFPVVARGVAPRRRTSSGPRCVARQIMLYVAIFGFLPRLGGGAWISSANDFTPASSRMRCSPADHS